MSENLNYEKFHSKYKITISYVQKIKLQVVLVRAYDTKIRIECKEIFFCTSHFEHFFSKKQTFKPLLQKKYERNLFFL